MYIKTPGGGYARGKALGTVEQLAIKHSCCRRVVLSFERGRLDVRV